MLSGLQKLRSLDVQLQRIEGLPAKSAAQTEAAGVVVVDLVCDLSNASAWSRLAGACTNTIRPLCSQLQGMIMDDVDTVTQVFYELECQNTNPIIESKAKHNFDIPTIVITRCPATPCEIPSRIPLQDGAFGEQLTVPNYPAFNSRREPTPSNSLNIPRNLEKRLRNGHWQTIIPTLEQQDKKGMLSVPIPPSRRSRAS